MQGLGEGEQACVFFQKSLDIAERIVTLEPDRADFLRQLSVSYNKMGDLMQILEQGQQARAFFQKSRDIAERLSVLEPGRANSQVDLVLSLARMGDRASLNRALKILQQLDREQRLMPEDLGKIAGIERLLAELKD